MNSEAGRATLWILGESTVAEFPNSSLFTTYCGVGAVVQDQALGVNPDVVGQTSFAFAPTNCTASFGGDVFSLNGGCPAFRNYDGYTAGGTAVTTHRYRGGTTLGPAAVLMNARPATNANTIVMGFGWFDIRSTFCTPPGCPNPSTPAKALASKILGCALTAGCQEPLDPSGVPNDDETDVPPVSALHQNVPNPFNPTTTIAFDLARAGHVRLEVFDVGGRIVRVLVDEERPAARNHRVVWDGLDAARRARLERRLLLSAGRGRPDRDPQDDRSEVGGDAAGGRRPPHCFEKEKRCTSVWRSPQLGPDLVVNFFTRSVAGAALPPDRAEVKCDVGRAKRPTDDSSRKGGIAMKLTMKCLQGCLVLAANAAWAELSRERHEVAPIEEAADWNDATTPVAGKALQDTVWIADWNFDAPDGSCTSEGWLPHDNRILNDNSNYWQVTTDYAGGVITNFAAVLRKHDLCWAQDGYGNNWDYSIILNYSGPFATLSFTYRADTEMGFDFITVEGDSLGLSESLVDYSTNPSATPAAFRDVIWMEGGDHILGSVVAPLALPNYGPGVHEAYIRFQSDGAVSPEDGEQTFALGAGLVVDQIVVTGGTAYSENFEGVLNANVTLVNTAPATPFGGWARLFKHLTDNDKCTENTTCAWIFTDPTSIASFADMSFGPGSAVIRHWADEIIVSPWASLASTPSAQATILSFRRFPGKSLHSRRRGTGLARARQGQDREHRHDRARRLGRLREPVGHTSMFNSLSVFQWVTSIFDATAFYPGNSDEVQFSFRVTDWRYLTGAPPPATLNPGPGPYLDRVRIGRRVLSGPLFDIGLDTRFQAQDGFASTVNGITPGQHHSPSTDRFGTCDFRQGQDGGNRTSTQIVSGDSVTTNVLDSRLAGGITSVRWYGAITAGPHQGDAPAPYTVSGGFLRDHAGLGPFVERRGGREPLVRRHQRRLPAWWRRSGLRLGGDRRGSRDDVFADGFERGASFRGPGRSGVQRSL